MAEEYFVEDLSSSDEDHLTWKKSGLIDVGDSPLAILAFSITSDRDAGTQSPDLSISSCHDQEESSSDETVEEWMMLDQEEEEEGDSTIQLNLSFSMSSDEDTEDLRLFENPWAVSKRDKDSGKMFSICRYFMPDQSLFCPICKKIGHLAKSCQVQKKCPVCVLCGIQGHLQKECSSRPCTRCGLPSHGFRACDRLPVWNQHCQRCGLMGHLSDVCPDTWRQYHDMITMTDSPVMIQSFHTTEQKKRPTYCYNCSRRGHHGHECSMKRMISGTFSTLPYVCHYDTTETALHSKARNRHIEHTNGTSPLADQQKVLETFGKISFKDKDLLFQRGTKIKQKAQASGRKTWPERRRQRQEVKRLRREAQARREGGLMKQSQSKPDDGDDMFPLDPFGARNPWHYTRPLKKPNKTFHQRNKNSRKTQRECLKRKGQKNHDFLYPLQDIDLDNHHLSPKQRVRHRRK